MVGFISFIFLFQAMMSNMGINFKHKLCKINVEFVPEQGKSEPKIQSFERKDMSLI